MDEPRPPTLQSDPSPPGSTEPGQPADPGSSASPGATPAAPGVEVNVLAELVADLLEATALVPADRLAIARGRAGPSGSLAEALRIEGVVAAPQRFAEPTPEPAPAAAPSLPAPVGGFGEPEHPADPALPAAAPVAGSSEPALRSDSPAAPPSAGREVNVPAQLVADLLEATGLVASDRLASARNRAGSGSLAQALLDEGLASGDSVARAIAGRYHLPYIDVLAVSVTPDAVEQIPLAVLERAVALPYHLGNGVLQVAIADPSNIAAIDELRLATRYSVELAVGLRDDILTEIKRFGRVGDALAGRGTFDLGELEVEVEDEDDLELDDGVSDAPLVRLVNAMIFQAAEDGASDVHVEAQEDCLLVRFRVDGVLQEMQRIPKRLANGVTTRLKVLAKLDIAERRKPQDGRISLNAAAAGRRLDIRVATLPTVEGESVVLRLLDKSKRAPTLEELGLSEEMRSRLRDIVKRPTGALLVTGPTGSGKSTTLYASLAEINRPEINIITVEDPVEYRLTGVNQVQINQRAGLTFAAALRSILRSDPDVVMVGEIRDGETAKISIEAALTGHLVLSSLHTNDAPSAITRLTEMGVEPFLTGSAVSAVLAQRLARKLCSHCCELYSPSVDDLLKAHLSPEAAASQDGVPLYRKVGCPRCNQTGYKGRVGVFQLLQMSEEMESLAVAKASRDEIERAAVRSGMRSLWDDGLAKVASGLTSVEELTRVIST